MESSLKILVTGGLGFIGSHACVELLNAGHVVIIVDNLSNSKIEVYEKIKNISKQNGRLRLHTIDLKNYSKLEKVFAIHSPIDLVIHFAGLKSVGESVKNPLLYYENNIGMTLNLLNCMNEFNCKNIIFSSSATVYGAQQSTPLIETDNAGHNLTNPYGKTKFYQEEILKDLFASDNNWSITLLRYFNPVGAHPSGLIGEDPLDIPNNLMPYLLDVTIGKRPMLNIFGKDWNTPDGTCIRDFIHVVDLAKGHVCALKKVNVAGVHTYNLGTGNGTSVLELVNTFEKINNVQIRYQFIERRQGDVESTYASVDKAYNELGWKAELTVSDMCKDAWNYALANQHINQCK